MAGLAAPALARGSVQATLRVKPSTVSIGTTATLIGSHLKSNQFVTLMLSFPRTAKGPQGALLGLGRVDKHGKLTTRVRIPVVTYCGPASLLVFTAQSGIMARASLTLTGCKAGKKIVAPPPPPSPVKSKHKKP
jgi:hypothetical protein